jgi:hypothetical protein
VINQRISVHRVNNVSITPSHTIHGHNHKSKRLKLIVRMQGIETAIGIELEIM